MDRNFKVRRYDWVLRDDVDVDIPEDWEIYAYDPRIPHDADCATCGTRITHDEAYGSNELHTVFGLPIRVCPACFFAEVDRRVEAWSERQEKLATRKVDPWQR